MILKFVEEKDVTFTSEKLMDLGVLQKILTKGTKDEKEELYNSLNKGFYYTKPSEPTLNGVVVIYSLSLVRLAGEDYGYKFLETKKTYEMLPSTIFSDKRKDLHSKSTWLDQASGYVTSISAEDLEEFFVL